MTDVEKTRRIIHVINERVGLMSIRFDDGPWYAWMDDVIRIAWENHGIPEEYARTTINTLGNVGELEVVEKDGRAYVRPS